MVLPSHTAAAQMVMVALGDPSWNGSNCTVKSTGTLDFMVGVGDPSWNGSNCTVKSSVPVGLIRMGNCCSGAPPHRSGDSAHTTEKYGVYRSEEHTSELQSPCNLVCRLLLEKKKKTQQEKQASITTHYL